MHARTRALTRAAVARTIVKGGDTCAIQAAGGRVSDGHGGYTTTFATKAGQSSVKCLAVSPKPQDVAVFADKIRGRMATSFQFVDGTDVSVGEHIVYQGGDYEVVGVKAPVTDEMIRIAVAVVAE